MPSILTSFDDKAKVRQIVCHTLFLVPSTRRIGESYDEDGEPRYYHPDLLGCALSVVAIHLDIEGGVPEVVENAKRHLEDEVADLRESVIGRGHMDKMGTRYHALVVEREGPDLLFAASNVSPA
ncbi:hypothetical protein H0H81_012004 [Sphagnurus paluster]|uniref:Uncharacterized protein n=1 Tax=Sphagnurus paluster TaxID=117069 RepID=A0A9P7KI49_9AGAR|nr:hypothetical protein H0H81_012004 [Sphagnurus paluster]